jgi:hypothetical protein
MSELIEQFKGAIAKAEKEKTRIMLAVEYGISDTTIWKTLNGEEPTQPRVREAIAKIIEDFTGRE